MEKKVLDKEKLYRSIAGILFIVAEVWNVINALVGSQLSELKNSDFFIATIVFEVYYIAYIIQGIIFFLMKKRFPVIALFGLKIILMFFSLALAKDFSTQIIFYLIGDISFVVIYLLESKLFINKIICFIPLAIIFIYDIYMGKITVFASSSPSPPSSPASGSPPSSSPNPSAMVTVRLITPNA